MYDLPFTTHQAARLATGHRPLATGHRLPATGHRPPATGHRAFTLIEMLIAMTLTLILVYAIAHFYAIVGDSVKDGRGMVELNQQMRGALRRLTLDLNQVSVPVVPWADDTGTASGYFFVSDGRTFPRPRAAGPPVVCYPASDWDVNGNYKLDSDYDVVATPGSDVSVDLNSDGINDFEDYVQRDATGNIKRDANNKPFFGGLLGDPDDIIGMTVRSLDQQFSGQRFQFKTELIPPQPDDGQFVRPSPGAAPVKVTNEPVTVTAYSPYAEVVWWTSFIDRSIQGTPLYWDLNEPRQLHRRQLVVRSELNVIHTADPAYGSSGSVKPNTPFYFKIQVPSNLADPTAIYLYDVYQYADVSMRPDFDLTAGAGGAYIYFVANSLADLARRENRFMHQWNYGGYSVPGMDTTGPNPPQVHNFPYALDLNPNYAGNLQPNANPFFPSQLQPRHQGPSGNPNQGSQYRWALFDGGRRGEDVILSNLLAFDVRVFDPEAILRPDSLKALNTATLSDVPLQPGDAGYAYAVASAYSGAPYGYSWAGISPPPFVKGGMGTGAYVDVGYGAGLGRSLPFLSMGGVPTGNVSALLFGGYNQYSPVLGSSQFVGSPSVPQSFINYDTANGTTLSLTWQNTLGLTWDTWSATYERDGINQDSAVEATPIVDEGTNGVDDDGVNGVDDASERETVPPYSNPLRGVQVRLRVYDPGTRQVRQATVVGDFVK